MGGGFASRGGDWRPGQPAAAVDEHGLLARIGAGEREAFRALYLVYHKRLSRFLLRFLRSPELIEEVINDTLYTVWCKAGEFRGDSQVSTWIFGIAYRKALKALRSQASSPEVNASASLETLPPLEDAEAVRREMRESLDQALDALPPAQRLVIELAYYVGHSVEEIASITSSPVNTIKTRMFHARVKLRELLPEWRTGEER